MVNMALVKCPECGKEVSNSAAVCPNCGYGIKKYYDEKKKENTNKENLIQSLCLINRKRNHHGLFYPVYLE